MASIRENGCNIRSNGEHTLRRSRDHSVPVSKTGDSSSSLPSTGSAKSHFRSSRCQMVPYNPQDDSKWMPRPADTSSLLPSWCSSQSQLERHRQECHRMIGPECLKDLKTLEADQVGSLCELMMQTYESDGETWEEFAALLSGMAALRGRMDAKWGGEHMHYACLLEDSCKMLLFRNSGRPQGIEIRSNISVFSNSARQWCKAWVVGCPEPSMIEVEFVVPAAGAELRCLPHKKCLHIDSEDLDLSDHFID